MKKKWILLIICLILSGFLYSLEISSFDKAFLFNVPSILLEVQAYQGGIGFKTGPGTWFIRGMADFFLEDDGLPPSEFTWGAGIAFEKHLSAGKVSPYLGGAMGIHYSSSRTDIDGGDWSQQEILECEFGPLLGIELEFLENLSLFAEYQLLVQLGWPSVTTFTGGEEERISGDMQWSVDLSLGNAGMIGLCIYF
jgi:hypothetical protein